MKLQKRIVVAGVLNRCYQRTIEGKLIFYSVSDYLVFFTILCIVARRFRIKVLSVSLMPDHIHLSVLAETSDDLSGFIGLCTRWFSREHNSICHCPGPLFESPFGSAPKYGDKKVRTNLIYVGNNGPERKLCKKAEDYRWGFLAYAVSRHPFSEPLVLRRASYRLRMSVKEVQSSFRQCRPLSYHLLQRLFKKLGKKEKEQLTDYIISTYNVIDYKEAIRYFGSYEKMLIAMHSTTGNEFDIQEHFTGRSDACYAKISTILMRELHLSDIHDVLALSEDERSRIAKHLYGRTEATSRQLAAYLRLPVGEDKMRDQNLVDCQ